MNYKKVFDTIVAETAKFSSMAKAKEKKEAENLARIEEAKAEKERIAAEKQAKLEEAKAEREEQLRLAKEEKDRINQSGNLLKKNGIEEPGCVIRLFLLHCLEVT